MTDEQDPEDYRCDGLGRGRCGRVEPHPEHYVERPTVEPLPHPGHVPGEWACSAACFEAAGPPVDPLREAAQEVDAAFAAKPDVDENDHPEGLSKEAVERAWTLWDIRQQKALAALRAALASGGTARD